MRNFDYYAPGTLQEALSLLDERKKEVRVLAGGTDLTARMKDGNVHPALIMDIKKIAELNRLEWSADGSLHIGAAVPLSKVAGVPAVRERFGILAQACALIGSVQIRNRGTVGGNICNAAPSARTSFQLVGESTVVFPA